MRQRLVKENDPGREVSISTLSQEYASQFQISVHAHGSDQLIYASRGVMEVKSGTNMWIIPPHFGLWIRAGTPHQIRMLQAVSMRTLYLRRGLTDLRAACTVLHIGSLLRELIFEIVRIGKLRSRNRLESAMRDLLVAQLKSASAVPTGVTLPIDQRAVTITQAVIANPGLRTPLKTLCHQVGVSVRTLERIFLKEVGMDFESWRRQVRLMKGIELLISGASVKEAAYSVGYLQPTAFVVLFKNTLGNTPKAWIDALNKGH
jgi:AraC-like DNA-binding protein